MTDLIFHNEKRKIIDLISWEKNPRIMTEKQEKDLTESIDKFNLMSIPVVNTDNIIVSGHQRIKILKKMGRENEEIDVRIPNRPMTESEVEEAAIRENKNLGQWDFGALANFDEKLLESIGFESNEIDKIFELDTEKHDETPEIKKETDIKSGDLFVLGEHKLLCGDSTHKDDILKLMGDEKATFCFTSPPYWVGKEYENEKSVDEIENFIQKTCECLNLAVNKDSSRVVINTGTSFTTAFDKTSKKQTLLLIDKWTNHFFILGWNLRHIRHWIKSGQLIATSPKSDMIDQHCEFIGTFENSEGVQINFNDVISENQVNILETFYHREGDSKETNKTSQGWALQGFWDDIKGNAKQTGHTAAFPVELVRRHLLLYTKRGDIVIDPFCGSGTTLITCELMKRKCRTIELNPIYCQLSIDRWQEMTGKKAEKIA